MVRGPTQRYGQGAAPARLAIVAGAANVRDLRLVILAACQPVVMTSESWNTYILTKRNYLVSKLSDPKNLTKSEIMDIARQLKEVNQQIASYQKASQKGQACSGH